MSTKQPQVFNFDVEIIPYPSYFLQDSSDQLNQSDIQRLQFVLRTILNSIGNDRKELKRNASKIYTLCDPAKPDTEYYFQTLNKMRDAQRNYKKFYKQLAALQNKLKKMQKVTN